MKGTIAYEVEFVEPGEYLVKHGTEYELDTVDTPVKVAELEDGRWVSWVPYYEGHTKRDETPLHAVASNRYVAAGAIQDYYWNDE